MDWKDKKNQKNYNFFESLKNALSGIRSLVKEERNFRFHILAAAFVIFFAWILHIRTYQFLWLVLAILLVILAELINTLIERIIDLIVGNQFNLLAKKIKDIAAGGVLITAFIAIIIGVTIFTPTIIRLFNGGTIFGK